MGLATQEEQALLVLGEMPQHREETEEMMRSLETALTINPLKKYFLQQECSNDLKMIKYRGQELFPDASRRTAIVDRMRVENLDLLKRYFCPLECFNDRRMTL